MSGGFALLGGLSNVQGYNAGVNSGPILLTAPGANNTKAAWTQLTASSTGDIAAVLVQLFYGNAAGNTKAFDIGVGASGSETVLIPNLSGWNNLANTEFSSQSAIFIPINIPANTRISARYQTNSGFATEVCKCGVIGFDGEFVQSQGCGYVDQYGYDITNTRGTQFTTGAANTKGSYAQLTASTTRDLIGFFLAFDNASVNGGGSSDYRLDLAIGAGGSELIILPDLMFRVSLTGQGQGAMNTLCPFIPMKIPSGTRIAVRAQDQAGGSSARATFYGVG